VRQVRRSVVVAFKRAVRDLLGKLLLRYARGGRRDPGAAPAIHILLSSAWGMGGTIRTVLNVAGYLARERHVRVITAYRRREQPYFPFAPGVEVIALDDQRPGSTPRHRRPLRRLLRAHGSVLVHPADLLYDDYSLWSDIRLARLLRRAGGCLVGTRPGHSLLAAGLGRPGLVTLGWEHMHLSQHKQTLQAAIARAYPRLDGLVVLTERDRAEYRARLGARPPVWRIPNAVDDIRPPLADLGARTVLAVGRFKYQKGFELLIDAFAGVAERHPDWKLRIVGHGHLRERMEEQIAALGLDGAVELPGPTDEVPGEMARASIYALSSRFEGFPLVLIEAMSKGMAIAAFDCPTGPAELIDDHRNGLLVPALDGPGLTAAICELIEDAALRERCGAAALETAREYTLDAIGRRWDAVLAELGL
jgi:glycosyltransferase involved in cell wall biosynthesis